MCRLHLILLFTRWFLVVGFISSLSFPAGAATYTVTTTADSGAGSLRQAISDANSTSDFDVIDATGISGTITLSSELEIRNPVIINGSGKDSLVISGNNSVRVFYVNSSSIGDVTIQDLTIQEGKAMDGAGIYNSETFNSSLILRRLKIDDNHTLTGGGLYHGGAVYNKSELVMSDVVVSYNSADDYGGGIYNASTANLILVRTEFSHNECSAFNGGGIYNDSGTVSITESTFDSNYPANDGGGIFNFASSIAINQSSFFNNGALIGGGLANEGSASVINCTFTKNDVMNAGGAIANAWTGSPSLNLINSTIVENIARVKGGGIYNNATLTVANSIISNNSIPAGLSPEIYNDTAANFSSAGNNIFGFNDGLGIDGALPTAGTYLTPPDALLLSDIVGDLQDNGGPTQTRAPVFGGLAWNAGDNDAVPTGLEYDQRGGWRILNDTVDIGAVEIGTVPLNDTGITSCSDATTQNGLDCADTATDFPRQDAEFGSNGFNFTKLDADGNDLPATATDHTCTRDNVTGLIWEVKTDDELRDKDWTYTWYDSIAGGTVSGTTNCKTTGRCDTEKYVADVNAAGLCGYHDWRMPTIKELMRIAYFSTNTPTIDPTYFPNTVSGAFWSESPDANDSAKAWYISFSSASAYLGGRNNPRYVRLVRSGQSFDSFVDNDDGTVTQINTGLMWAKCSEGETGTECDGTGTATTMNWSEALNAANTANLSGYNDWRLPNVKELQSLVDYSATSTINADYFPNSPNWLFWSASSYTGDGETYPEMISFYDGASTSESWDENSGYVRLVRGGLSFNTFTLTVNKTGNGTVTSNGNFINCGAICSHSFLDTTRVTLTAEADSGSVFTGWSDDSCSGTGDCVVTMDDDYTVTAEFSPPATANSLTPVTMYSLTINTVGDGSVTDVPILAGVNVTNFNYYYSFSHDLEVLADDKILVVGQAADEYFALVRYTTDGYLDTTFGSDNNGRVTTNFGNYDSAYSLTLQSDNKILVAGKSDDNVALVRYSADGVLDTSFGNGGQVAVDLGGIPSQVDQTVLVDANNKIVIAGENQLARYTSAGFLDTSFDTDGKVTTVFNGVSDEITSIAFDVGTNAGKVLVAGTISSAATNVDFGLARYNADGSLDTSFGGGTGKVTTDFGLNQPERGNALAVQNDGKILIAGSANDYNDFALARYNTDGSLDTSFGGGTGKVVTNLVEYEHALSLTIQSNDKILVAGKGNDGEGNAGGILIRYNTDGSLDTSFGSGGSITEQLGLGYDEDYSVALTADGRILLAAADNRTGGTDQFLLARYTSSGTLDPTFNQINCTTSSCSFNVDSGSIVTLTAKPNSGLAFSGWTDACSGIGNCTVALDAVRIVNATFNTVTAIPVNDTGITTCSNASANNLPCPVAGFPDQDAEHGTNQFNFTKLDASGNPLPATATNHVCVKDNVTGLVWEVKTDDGGLRDKDNTYDFSQAATFANTVSSNGLCGSNTWRVPTVKELLGIVDYGRTAPSIDLNYFPNIATGNWYWSSSAYANDAADAWYVDFGSNGNSFGHDRSNPHPVRLVSGTQSLDVFVVNGDETVTQSNTGLMWAKCAVGLSGSDCTTGTALGNATWSDALTAANTSTLGGHTDWRLPTVKELQSLMDYSQSEPAIGTDFPNTNPNAWLWSSTPIVNAADKTWYIHSSEGYIGDLARTTNSNIRVRLVRGGQSFQSFNLTVATTGTGSGTVTTDLTGTNCGANCQVFNERTIVVLTATHGVNSTFTSWNGCMPLVAHSDQCYVTMDAAKTVTANFAITQKTLYISRFGNGRVFTDDSAINCGETCFNNFNYDTNVTLKTSADAGYVFSGWNVCTGSDSCIVTMDGNKNVTATFTAITYPIAITIAPTGSGTVNCTNNPVTYGGNSTCTAVNNSGYTFNGFSGDCAGSTCELSNVTANKAVTANFTAIPIALTVTSAGTGSGTITSVPAGIDCNTNCTANFASGSEIILNATAATGSTFTGWSGGICSGTGACTVQLTAAQTITATFRHSAATLGLNDTGINTCGNANTNRLPCPVTGFPRQDAEYGTNQFDFTKLDVSGNELAATATDHACVRDNVTGLTWEIKTKDGGSRDHKSLYQWTERLAYVKKVNAAHLCGFNDWRVPDIKELTGIVSYQHVIPKLAIVTSYFSDLDKIGTLGFWSEATSSDIASSAWFLYFTNGAANYGKHNKKYHLRLVRGAPASNVLVDNNNGTISQTNTGLMWAKCSEGQTGNTCAGTATVMTWEQALVTASNSKLANYSDWRLPNIKELQTLIEYERDGAVKLNNIYFPNTPSGALWSSTPFALYARYAWYLYPNGYLGSQFRTKAVHVRLVRSL